jgi:hypothetical protein
MPGGPIFVGGAERSGTSLLYALLTSHPNIAMMRRTNLWTYFYGQYGDLARTENFDRCLAEMMRYKRLVVLRPDPDRIRREFWVGPPTYARLFALIGEQHAERAGKARWGDKSLNTERYADAIFAAYPEARLIHVLRDPRDRFASALKRWKRIRGGVGSGTGVWLNSARLAQRNAARYPDRYRVVRYETLVAEPEATVKELCAFVREDYVSQMLSMAGASNFRDDGGNSSFEPHPAGRISTRSVGRFQRALSPAMIAFIQAAARSEMEAYAYQRVPVELTAVARLRFYGFDLPLNLARMLTWQAREAYADRAGRSLPSYRIVEPIAAVEPLQQAPGS